MTQKLLGSEMIDSNADKCIRYGRAAGEFAKQLQV